MCGWVAGEPAARPCAIVASVVSVVVAAAAVVAAVAEVVVVVVGSVGSGGDVAVDIACRFVTTQHLLDIARWPVTARAPQFVLEPLERDVMLRTHSVVLFNLLTLPLQHTRRSSRLAVL